MDSESQNEGSEEGQEKEEIPPNPYEFLLRYQSFDKTWFRNLMRPHPKLVKMVALDHIESFAIEMFYQDYEESGGDKKYRFVNLGKVTIDLLHM